MHLKALDAELLRGFGSVSCHESHFSSLEVRRIECKSFLRD